MLWTSQRIKYLRSLFQSLFLIDVEHFFEISISKYLFLNYSECLNFKRNVKVQLNFSYNCNQDLKRSFGISTNSNHQIFANNFSQRLISLTIWFHFNSCTHLRSLPVSLSRMSLQLSTSPMLEKRDLISSWVIVWGK